ncbi:MAG: M24 family metallopeptidase, partial [Pseudomonadota bacterium]
AAAQMLGYDSGIDYATLSAHGNGKPTMITSQIGLYFQGTAQSQLDLMNVEIVGFPADFEEFASLTDPADIANAPGAPFLTRRHDLALESESERYRHALVARQSDEIRASIEAALLKQVLDNPLPNKTIAIDDLRIKELLQRSGMDVRFVDGERIVRKIRIQKTPQEIALMRYAASNNATASRAAAMSVRDGASYDDLRREFWKECADRDMTGHYMMVDTLMTRVANGDIEKGRTFLIDCVSTFRGYHGDYGRTVCVGEPNRKMAAIIDALSLTWNRLLEDLKPGMRFSQIIERGKALYADTNIDVAFNVNPHTIGLHHSDDENVAGFGSYMKADIELEENMILSVDMPLLDSGLGGTAHLEDLVLITKDGPELINDSSDRFIVV